MRYYLIGVIYRYKKFQPFLLELQGINNISFDQKMKINQNKKKLYIFFWMAYLIPIAHLVSHHNRIAASFHYVAIFFLLLRSVCLIFFLHFYIFLASILSFLLNTVFLNKKNIVLWFVGFLILFAKPILKIWHLKIFCQLNCVLTCLVDSHRHVKKSETISKFSTIYFLYFWYETIYFQILTLLSLDQL